MVAKASICQVSSAVFLGAYALFGQVRAALFLIDFLF